MNTKNQQHGFVLLEGLIAILIFSMAILGVVGMQATAIAKSSESQYRADAAFLANQLFAQMWVHAGSGVFVLNPATGTQQIMSRQAAAAAGIDVTATADAPNLSNYHCMACTVARARAAGLAAGDPEFVTWLQSIQGTANQRGFLPGVSDGINAPDIDVHCSAANGASSVNAVPPCPANLATQVTVTLRWQRKACAPNTACDTPQHQYQTLSNIEPN
ncbi:MAG: hypothetical protein WAO71_13300 [Gallionella sp.]